MTHHWFYNHSTLLPCVDIVWSETNAINVCNGAMNLNRNAELFNTGVSVGLKGLETISKYSGYDVEGLEKELMNDRDFLLDLQIIQAEIDMSKYINPKSSAFLKVVRRMYMLNQQNEVKKQLDNVLNDPNKLNEIKNLK